jgi:hypothetical protein
MRRSLPVAVVAAIVTIAGAAPGRGISARLAQGNAAAAVESPDTLETAKSYFDHARRLGFAAAGQTTPYLLRAEFTTRASSGVVTTGTYTDTWANEKQWRREAVLGDSRFIRSRNGKKWYRTDDGPDATLLQFVLIALEPLPETSGKHMAKWKVQRDGTDLTRVWRGKENADGTPDTQDFEAYWFDKNGQLVRSYLNGLDIKRDSFEDFNGVHVARQLQVILSGKVGMKISVTQLQPLGAVDTKIFTMKGNDWLRDYTVEVR